MPKAPKAPKADPPLHGAGTFCAEAGEADPLLDFYRTHCGGGQFPGESIVFEGMFRKGKLHGKGKQTFRSVTFAGTFRDGVLICGRKTAGAYIEEGTFTGDHLQGTVTKNGCTFAGEFGVEGKFNLQNPKARRPIPWMESFERDVAAPGSEATEKTLANGEVHTGWFNAEGQLHGRGNITFPNGHSSQHYTFSNGHSHQGTFEKGRLVVGRKFEGSNEADDDHFHCLDGAEVVHADGWSFCTDNTMHDGMFRDGTFDKDGELEGEGQMCRAIAEGTEYERGTFASGKLHGWGQRFIGHDWSEPGTYGEFHHGELAPSTRQAAELAKVAIQEAVDAAVAAACPPGQQAEEYQLTPAGFEKGSLARLQASQVQFLQAERAFHAPIAKPAAKPEPHALA